MKDTSHNSDINIAITAASYSGNKGAAAMLQSSLSQLYEKYGSRLNVKLMSVYPDADIKQVPFDFVEVVPAKPERLVFFAFPLAVLYKAFGWIPGVKKLIGKNRIIGAYRDTDLVIDEAGISFSDNRGFVMNTYAFMTMAVPKLIGVPVVKYSQAMGSFESFFNRMYAKLILPKLELICARGDITMDNLRSIGADKKSVICADGAFSMKDDPKIREKVAERTGKDSFFDDNVVGLSLSSVVDKKCRKLGINYRGIMTGFIKWLIKRGYNVLLIANAARLGSTKPRNNDLMVCDDIYGRLQKEEYAPHIRWYHEEMDAEEIREYIGRCRFLVASRFHAMIGALERKVSVLLIGWSHKYKEVLDMFEIGEYASDYKEMKGLTGLDAVRKLAADFRKLEKDEQEIRGLIDLHYDEVMESSRKNIKEIGRVIDKTLPKRKRKGFPDRLDPEKYMGEFIECRRGYASDESIRKNAASGGVVTALLVSLLKSGDIDGAFVTKTVIKDGELSYESMIATDAESIKSCSSSIYMYMPLLKDLDKIRHFNGKVAVVLTPCQLKALDAIMKKDKVLAEKVVLKLGLFCSGNHHKDATLFSLEKAGLSLEDAERLYFRRGNWRGRSTVIYNDGSEKDFSYTKTLCAYKNAYFFERKECMLCQEHFAKAADISFGDIWLGKMKKEPVKTTGVVLRSEAGKRLYEKAVNAGDITDRHMSSADCLKGQKRALAFKFSTAKAKEDFYKKQGKNVKLDTSEKCGLNHRLAFKLAEADREFSEKHPGFLKKIPMKIIYYYMCLIRTLLSF
ncbi:MAG: Coenzyme F420 hydrogenase/dehydrogenase, beta subunit C-terminal domain [Lachnospiraceae bacterium]|nr:Coenzyme F420 hydrogenase/dehydrogenase, beta subunit C-terminal domain [Lachnospiraceae bacterium]